MRYLAGVGIQLRLYLPYSSACVNPLGLHTHRFSMSTQRSTAQCLPAMLTAPIANRAQESMSPYQRRQIELSKRRELMRSA